MKSCVKPQKGKVQQASPPFLTVMVRTARDPCPPAWRPLFTAARMVLPGGLLAVPSLGPPALMSGMTWGRGVFRRYVPCSSRLKGNPRKGAVNTGNLGPPQPVHATVPAVSSLPLSAPLRQHPISHAQHPDASPSAYEARPPPAASSPTWACRAPRICGCRPHAPSERSRRQPCLRPPAALLHWPSGCWLVLPAPLRAAAPVRALPQGVRQRLCPSCPRARQTRRRLDWEQSPAPSTEQEAGVFLPCGDAGVGNFRPIPSLRLIKRIPQSCSMFSF